MRGIERRVLLLEEHRRRREGSFGHMSDEELDAQALGLIQQIGDAGVILPADWSAQYYENPARLLIHVGDLAAEAIRMQEEAGA